MQSAQRKISNKARLNGISAGIIGAAIEVHRVLGGPGLLESIYEEALYYELTLRGYVVKRQFPVPVIYKGREIKHPLFLDLLVEDKVIVEVKSAEKHNPIFETQLMTYLRATRCQLGLLINFGQKYVKQGIYRVVHDFPD